MWLKMSGHAYCFVSQISRLLVVDPAVRLTAEQALAHPFFRVYQKENSRLFSPRKTFRVSLSGFVISVGRLFKSNLGF